MTSSAPPQPPAAAAPPAAVAGTPQISAPPRWRRPAWRSVALWAWQGLGASLAVGAMEIAAHLGETPLALIPFATSIVLVLSMPDAEAAQPRALVGGHVISTLVGFAMLALFGRSEPAAAAAVGLAVVAMRATRTLHPPAAINPIIVVIEGMTAGFLMVPVLSGALMLLVYAFGWHNMFGGRKWPVRWW
ncbi:HPP family protein [Xanthobacter sp. KR7-65]|uniref:HPP family protein n=1 Tax=Xanthobacter sp. KR7-65 TaxID=3156612 RepID=UPI0032B4C7D8